MNNTVILLQFKEVFKILNHIPKILSPELLKVLCEMGHGDTIVLADGNFPSESIGKNSIVIRADGHGVPELLDAILSLFPLDNYPKEPVALMDVVAGDTVKTPIWEDYARLVANYDPRGKSAIRRLERFAFYEEAKKAYAVVATGESALYANIILQKGVVL